LETMRDFLLLLTLQAAVPLRIQELQTLEADDRDAVLTRWAEDAVDAITSRGDALWGGRAPGAAADVCNHLARGLAALAYQPGGVRFADQRWEVCSDDVADDTRERLAVAGSRFPAT
jgi:hypothetical protein